MKIYPDTKVYVLCPSKIQTGGPESLHQLASQLIQFGVETYIVYTVLADNETNPVGDAYKKYHVPYADRLEDAPQNIVVISETTTNFGIYSLKRCRHIIWWMSVDNYLETLIKALREHLLNPLAEPVPKFFYFQEPDGDIEHWGQSEYVRQFLRINGVTKIKPIETPMRQNFLSGADKINFAVKENIVAYNPRKGFEVTEQLIRLAPDINWQPIENMTPAQVQALLAKAKVYIDLGNFPGRERLPREAILSGCVVITNRYGAAANDVDINIPAEFKFDLENSKPYQVIEKICDVFDNFSANYDKQRAFLDKELNAKKNFEFEVAKAFEIKTLPPPSVAFVQGVGEESFQLAAELFNVKNFAPRFIVDDFFATAEISHNLILREQNRNYLRVGENFIEIITRDDAKFLYWEGRIKKFALLEPDDAELAELQNFYESADEDILIFER